MTLYEIDELMGRCFITEDGEAVDTETGEIFDAEYLDNLQMERDRKIRNIACWVKNLRSDAEQLKAEAKKMTDRAKAKTRRADSLQRYLQRILAGEKVETPEFKVSYRRTKDKVTIDNILNIPSDFFKSFDDFTATDRTNMLQKTKVKDFIKKGGVCPGAHLEDSVSMQIK